MFGVVPHLLTVFRWDTLSVTPSITLDIPVLFTRDETEWRSTNLVFGYDHPASELHQDQRGGTEPHSPTGQRTGKPENPRLSAAGHTWLD